MTTKEQQLTDEIKFLKDVGNHKIKRRDLMYILKIYRYQLKLGNKEAELKGFQEAHKETLIEVEKMIDEMECLSLSHNDKLPIQLHAKIINGDKFKQQLKQLGDK